VRRLLTEIGRLRDDHAAINAMRAASARLGRPGDAGAIAELIAGLVPARPARAAGAWPMTGLVTATEGDRRAPD